MFHSYTIGNARNVLTFTAISKKAQTFKANCCKKLFIFCSKFTADKRQGPKWRLTTQNRVLATKSLELVARGRLDFCPSTFHIEGKLELLLELNLQFMRIGTWQNKPAIAFLRENTESPFFCR